MSREGQGDGSREPAPASTGPARNEYGQSGTGGGGSFGGGSSAGPPGRTTAVVARDAVPGAPTPSKLPPSVSGALQSEAGSPLPDAGRWSGELGADVSHAKVVTGPTAATAAADLNANAFAVGD